MDDYKTDKDKQIKTHLKQNTNKDQVMTNDTGTKQSNDEWSLKAGKRGPTLLQDTHFYRKQSHFNRERIPEKVVHARGFGLYGEFETYKSMENITKAHFLKKAGEKTPVFVRFSNFVGSRGSKDTAIDVRGFATKFYTKEGNYDMLGLQFPVFLVADAMKFADMVHSIKPDPQTDTPQAASAHDSFWDYVANNQETAHMVMWLMSMRGRPRSWRMMEGYPINTFRFINEDNQSTFVRFVWKPLLGVHSLLLDEANIIGGIDPDYHRNDIIQAVENGIYPEYELGVQLIEEKDEFKYDFDILDDTKLWPEEEIPIDIIGKMTLNRLVDNFFAEEEQSSFDPSTLVPGIDFSNDPVIQGRTFAYRDTDYHRLGSSNINEIPVNKPIAEVNSNYRDGFMRNKIDVDTVDYHNNSLANNTPKTVSAREGGYESYPEDVSGNKTREIPSESFTNYFDQARVFWNSMSSIEKEDLINTFSFHLGSVKNKSVRQQNIEMWSRVDKDMANEIAKNIGVSPSETDNVATEKSFPSLSLENTVYDAKSRKVGVIVGDDFNDEEVTNVFGKLLAKEIIIEVISDKLGTVKGNNDKEIEVDKTFLVSHPMLFDSLYIVGGKTDKQDKFDEHVSTFINTAYKYYKPIGIATTAHEYSSLLKDKTPGVVFAKDNSNFSEEFIAAIAKERFWDR